MFSSHSQHVAIVGSVVYRVRYGKKMIIYCAIDIPTLINIEIKPDI